MRIAHRFSMGFKSGLLAGQGDRTLMLLSEIHLPGENPVDVLFGITVSRFHANWCFRFINSGLDRRILGRFPPSSLPRSLWSRSLGTNPLLALPQNIETVISRKCKCDDEDREVDLVKKWM